MATEIVPDAEANKRLFTNYVRDIAHAQRKHIAGQVQKLTRHESLGWRYFVGCVGGMTATVMLAFKLWGPRHMFKSSIYYARPVAPAVSMGVALYGVLYTCRGMLIRNRLCLLIEDYEFELKRIKAHHCEMGVDQLAWLEFIMDQIHKRNETRLDISKLSSL